jgi:hypothetical protein
MVLTLEADIVQWAASRPAWQQAVLRKLAEGSELSTAEIATIADELIADKKSAVAALKISDMPGSGTSGATIHLTAIQKLKNINRLLDDEEMTFAGAGITVIYGDNASGKSGYARLIKLVVGARHHEDVYPNVFGDSAGRPQGAVVEFAVNGEAATLAWPEGTDPELRQIHFYDEACGNDYLGGETELSYRPSVLVMLDGLIAVCDAVHTVLDDRVRDNDSARAALPTVPTGSSAAAFLAGLAGTTTKAEIGAACMLAPDSSKQLADLAQEEVRFRATNPEDERNRLIGLAAKVQTLADGVRSLATGLGEVSIKRAEDSLAKAAELRAAAAVASSTTFESEPISGVGSTTWRSLWEAARQFSVQEAYCGHEFPHTGEEARCVLCQQPLGQEAGDRFRRFQKYMQDTTEQAARTAEHELNGITTAIQALNLARRGWPQRSLSSKEVTPSWQMSQQNGCPRLRVPRRRCLIV